MDDKKKAAIYLLMLTRYKDMISEKEAKTVTEIRSMVAPRQPFIDSLLRQVLPEWPQIGRAEALDRILGYFRSIETCEFAFTFWLKPEEMDELRVADPPNKALLFAAFLRSLGFEDAKVYVTKNNLYYVSFRLENKSYLFAPKTNALLADEEISKTFAEDPPRYAFNDLVYDVFEPDS